MVEASPFGGGNGVTGDRRSLWRSLLLGRWLTLFASSLIMSVSGATYMFGLYSGDVKKSLGYDQTTLNLLSFFKDLGGNVGLVAGLINEITPPWVVLAFGVAMNFSGYFMIWLAVTGRISKPPVWQMCLYICVGANSQTYANTGAMVTSVKNFPESRGSVIGLLKGFVGLSGAIITQLYHAFYPGDSRSLILLIAWLPAAVSVVFLRVVRLVKIVTRQEKEIRVLYKLLYFTLVLAGFLMVVIILQNKSASGFSRGGYVGGATVVILLLIMPIVVVMREDFKLWKKSERVIATVQVVCENPNKEANNAKGDKLSEKIAVSCFKNPLKPPEMGEDYTIPQAVMSVEMAVIFFVTLCGVGGTLTAIDNLGQIGTALGYPPRSTSTFISLVSIWNYLGRVTSGFLSEILLTRYKFPRPLMLTMVVLLACVGHLLIAFGVPNSLYFASVIIGFCFGAQWPLIFAIISEIFGLKFYATLHSFSGVASPIGVYILNVLVAGRLYDKEGLRQLEAQGLTRKPGQDLDCKGVKCYRLAFIIITLVALLGSFVSLVLVFRTRKFYQGDIYKKFREQGDQSNNDVLASDSAETTKDDHDVNHGQEKKQSLNHTSS